MDTRFWGPSGWQLFHLIAFTSSHPHELLRLIPTILPCKFCRASSTEFVAEMPLKDSTDAAKWVYDLHCKVNHKLRTQCSADPNVVNPGEDPSFEHVKQIYDKMTPTQIPGRDFLMSIATNFPEHPDDEQVQIHKRFWTELQPVYPFKEMQAFIYIPDFKSRTTYQRTLFAMFVKLAKETHFILPPLKGYIQHVSHYKSQCNKKTYRGVTCRKAGGGRGFVKVRDHRKTFRTTRKSLL